MQFIKREDQWADGKKRLQNDQFETRCDGEWWEKFKKGHKSAFDYIYHTYSRQLFNYGCHLCNDRELVKDCVHDLFASLIKNRSRLGKTDSIKFYLLKAFKRRLLRLLKKQSNAKQREGIYGRENFRLSISDDSISLDNTIPKEVKEHIQKTVNRLPASQREAVILFYYEGLSYGEIADLMNLSRVKSARALIYRAVASLTKKIGPVQKVFVLAAMLLHQIWFWHFMSK
ncbi:sigma-70 family RNA polymerase sigma factor [Fulvivirgaceae bacterium BMA12]|uniref:Sigma-70 family RNA polymerase sigma factor n=1 Tax=Agaribacillus aureus TaxID=3051825 RepID=A0ABT8L7N1_9BACT|nr:sigma-70 family RNA polymerase sigma factor [Fulvivirgaceae bacterium BMA12]